MLDGGNGKFDQVIEKLKLLDKNGLETIKIQIDTLRARQLIEESSGTHDDDTKKTA